MKKKMFFCVLVFCFMFIGMLSVEAIEYQSYDIGQEIKYNPVTGEFCTGPESDNCYTFNVISNSEEKYIEVMQNKNIIENVVPANATQELQLITQGWNGVNKYNNTDNARIIGLEEIKNILGEDLAYNNSLGNYYINASNFEWLINNVDGDYLFGYWTSTPGTTNRYYWCVTFLRGNVILEQDIYDSMFPTGIRPVIKINRNILSYSIDFDSGDGSGKMEQLNSKGEVEIPKSNFTAPKGMVFDYWLLDGKKLYPGDTYNLTKDITLVAVYKEEIKPATTKPIDKTEVNNVESKENDKTTVSNPKTSDKLYLIVIGMIFSIIVFNMSYRKFKQK